MHEEARAMLKKMSIISKRLLRDGGSGDYSSAFKGAGMEFHQLREYVPGDDVRHIDWYSLAKSDKLMVKQYIQERDRQVILLIDVSASADYSSVKQSRQESMMTVAAGLATMAQASNDRVGACLFSDRVEAWFEPNRGRGAVHQLLQKLCEHTSAHKATRISCALDFLLAQKKRNAIVFILSDWIDDDQNYQQLLRVAGKHHDLIGVRFIDRCELVLPFDGYIDLEDMETGRQVTIDTRRGDGDGLRNFFAARLQAQRRMLQQARVDVLDLELGKSFIAPLLNFFHQRSRRSL